MAKHKKAADGQGNIRKRTVTRNGKTYTFWEARYSDGFDPGTGKHIQRSITGKTQGEVVLKLAEITASINSGSHQSPSKMTVGQWLDVWAETYLAGVKPRTAENYRSVVKNHLKPGLGAVRLDALKTHMIQDFLNKQAETLSPKTVKNNVGVLHRALSQAVQNKEIKYNPVDACVIPRAEKPEIHPFDDAQMKAFLEAIKGNRFEDLFTVTLFTGLRKGEVLGLSWDNVNLDAGRITIKQQLQLDQASGEYRLVTTKNSKGRVIAPAPSVMAVLRRVHRQQIENQLKSAGCWHNPLNLVFTDELGGHLTPYTVWRYFKQVSEKIGRPDARFHDLRHTYAVSAIRAGDDIKTVSDNLGHATVAFTLDVYGHVTDQMKQASADRMEAFIKSVSGV